MGKFPATAPGPMTASASRTVDATQVSRWETDGGQVAAEDQPAQAHHVARQLEAVADRLSPRVLVTFASAMAVTYGIGLLVGAAGL